MLRNYKDLRVWQKAYNLSLDSYRLTKDFPKDELYGLTAQIRRCSVSISSNIAEGYARHSTREYVRFLYIAYGSLAELETQLLISKDLKYINYENFQKFILLHGDVERMLFALIKSLKEKN